MFQPPEGKQIQMALDLPTTPIFLNKGGFKAVYKMRTVDGKDEAIKAVFIPSGNTDEESLIRTQLIARAFREIEALSRCSSKHMVRLSSVAPTTHNLAGHDFLIYSEEFLPGFSLKTWLEEKYLPSFQELILLFETLVELIKDLLKIGYLHRDIKPDNIMSTGLVDRPFVLLDLGIAYKMHATELTRGDSPPGTLRYMAPELLKPDYKDNMDFRSDLYAAALTVYVLGCGNHPFAPQPENMYATVYRILKSTPTQFAITRPDLPIAFCKIIDRCIRKRPALRYANLELLEDELRRVAL